MNPDGSTQQPQPNGQSVLTVHRFGTSAWISHGEVGLVTVNDLKHLECVKAALEKFIAEQ